MTATTAKTRAIDLKRRADQMILELDESQLETHPACVAFPTYSLRNQMLIYMQRPDATAVAGFHAWKKRGRVVRKGERGIKILAPAKYTKKKADGSEVERMAFRTVVVFDISQTDPLATD